MSSAGLGRYINALPDPPAIAPPRELDAYGAGRAAVADARAEALTLVEVLRVYPATWLVPAYAALVTLLAVLGGDGWRDENLSAFPLAAMVVAWLGVAHVFCSSLELGSWNAEGRRTQAVLRRAVRDGRHTWAAASGDVVRVYTLAPELRALRARRPRARVKVEVKGAMEFHAEEQADEAHAYVAEVERASRSNVAAVALARVFERARVAPDDRRRHLRDPQAARLVEDGRGVAGWGREQPVLERRGVSGEHVAAAAAWPRARRFGRPARAASPGAAGLGPPPKPCVAALVGRGHTSELACRRSAGTAASLRSCAAIPRQVLSRDGQRRSLRDDLPANWLFLDAGTAKPST
jgi:hypothetical protein